MRVFSKFLITIKGLKIQFIKNNEKSCSRFNKSSPHESILRPKVFTMTTRQRESSKIDIKNGIWYKNVKICSRFNDTVSQEIDFTAYGLHNESLSMTKRRRESSKIRIKRKFNLLT